MYTCKIVGVSVIEIYTGVQPEEEEHGKTVLRHLDNHTQHRFYKILLIFLNIIIVFNMFFNLVLVEVKLNGV